MIQMENSRMNNSKKYILLGLGIVTLLAVAANKAKQYYDQLQVRFAGFTIDELNITGNTTITFGIDIYNPTPVDLSVNSLVGDVYVNNHFFGVLTNYQNQIITAYTATRLQASMTVSTVTLASSLVKLLQDGTSSYNLRYNGFIVVEGVNLKLDFITRYDRE